MKLVKLEIENFRGIEHALFGLTKSVHFIVGDNGVGKSSIGDALEMLFCGTCKWTTEAGAGAAALIRSGTEAAVIRGEVITDGGELLQATKRIALKATEFGIEGWQGSSTDQYKAFVKAIGVSPRVIRACLRCGEFLADPKRRLSILLDAANVDISRETVFAAVPEEDRDQFGEAFDRFDLVVKSLDDINKIGRFAETARRNSNRALSDKKAVAERLRQPIAVPATPSGKTYGIGDIASVERALEKVRGERDEVLQQIGALKGGRV